jgi:LPPG:FO 2-phospho-L-lactate transferase
VALAGGVGAGKFLRGLVRVVAPSDLTVVGNVGDDRRFHGLHVSPDLDSVTYWLGGVMDRERGWGRAGETFRTTEELRTFEADDAWFWLGDLDLGTHLYRTALLSSGLTLSEATAAVASRFGVEARVLPVTDDRLETRVDVVAPDGEALDLHFQEYWVQRRAADEVKSVRFEGAAEARPAPGVLEALADADAVVICPSNPVVSTAPVLAVAGLRDAVAARRDVVVGVSPIVGGAVVAGMADRLMPAVGLEVSALGAARAYEGLLGGWVVDRADEALASRIGDELGVRVAVTDTLMVDDEVSEALARTALDLVAAS